MIESRTLASPAHPVRRDRPVQLGVDGGNGGLGLGGTPQIGESGPLAARHAEQDAPSLELNEHERASESDRGPAQDLETGLLRFFRIPRFRIHEARAAAEEPDRAVERGHGGERRDGVYKGGIHRSFSWLSEAVTSVATRT